MASIIALAEADDEKCNLVYVMDYRITDECLPIFNVNGTMRKTQKSKLVDALNMEVINPAPKEYIHCRRLSTPSLEDRERSDGTSFTWKDYASNVFDVILSRHRYASQILLVNDRYDMAFSIKDSERNLRSTNPNGTKNVFIRALDRFPSARSFQDFL